MRIRYLAALVAAAVAAPVSAQEDLGTGEIIVTGSRREANDFDDRVPAVGLRRTADFAIQPVVVTGDTRDAATRHDEIYQTIRRSIDAAAAHGVQLAFGDIVVQPLTPANYRDLTLSRDSRPDSERVQLLVKAPLGGGAQEATARIDRFLKAVKPVGRALIERSGDMTLSIVAPDQYRSAIGGKVAEDAAAMAAKFGPDYAVEVRGLNGPVEWSRAGLTEVFLYVPYELVIVPRP